jgi:hypothetical protein
MRARRSTVLAVLVGAALLLLATSASAVQRGPGSRGEGLHQPGLSCSGDTLRVTGVVRGVRDLGPVTVALQARSAQGTWTATGRSTTYPAAKPGRHHWAVNLAGLPSGFTSFRVTLTAAGRTVPTPVVDSTQCAPGTEVPEVPAAPLLPVTLALTAGGLLAVRSRREGRAAAA